MGLLIRYILWARASVRCEEGQTFVEYALLLVFIAIVAVVGAALVGNSISSVFSSVAGMI